MKQSLDVLSWNVKDGLEGSGNASKIAQQIMDRSIDVAVFLEATRPDVDLPDVFYDKMRANGYDVDPHNYESDDDRKDDHSLVVVTHGDYPSRPEFIKVEGRYTAFLPGSDDLPQIAAYHAFDRYGEDPKEFENKRIQQALGVIGVLDTAKKDRPPSVVMGDLNSMHHNDPIAKWLRPAGYLVGRSPAKEPGEPQTWLQHKRSLAQRLAMMADGRSLRTYEAKGFRDLDAHRQPTMGEGPVHVQLDHILATRDVLGQTRVVERRDISDHDGVTALLRLRDRM